MKLSPRYHGKPLIVLPTRDISDLVTMQRQRFAAILSTFDDAQWAHQSRCAQWTAQDVVSHLVEVNQFWTYSIRCALSGEPSTLLSHFDPVTNPARSVAKVRDLPANEILARFVQTNDQLNAAMADVTDWTMPAEAPPGHLPVSTSLHHALWDSWTHERDVMLPLGMEPVVTETELTTCLRYVVALSPAFALTLDESLQGSYGVSTTDPDLRFDIVADKQVIVHDPGSQEPTISGTALGVLEMLSIRTPFVQQIPPADQWMFTGLSTVFDEPS